jgi:hypothetical protein
VSETSFTVTDPAALLAPLTNPQQELVELVGAEFSSSGEWPIFQWVEVRLDIREERLDAVEVLNSFPALGGSYYAIHCPRGGLGAPGESMKVALTVVGMHHCKALDQDPSFATAYFHTLDLLNDAFRRAPVSPQKASQVFVSAHELISHLHSKRFPADRLPFTFLWEFLSREPPTLASYVAPGGPWEWEVDRRVRAFEGLASIDDYLERLLPLLLPSGPPKPAVPSPLELVAEIDFVDAIWRLIPANQRRHLFTLEGAERIAKLSLPAQTRDEFESRLSCLGELLRGANDNARGSRKKIATRESPLKDLEHALARLVAANAVIAGAIETLSDVVSVRDASQHGDAHARGVAAAARLGFDYPPRDPAAAWEIVTRKTTDALVALREELQPVTR